MPAVGFGERYEYLLHDRDSIFANRLDESIGRLEVKVLKSPPHRPMDNAICERVIGTVRRECLDWLIRLSASHLRSILKSWVPHYNTGRPHMALGPGASMRRSPLSTTHIQIRAIAAENRMRSVPMRSLAACITNTFLSQPVRD